MVLKYKQNISYNLVITLLVILLMLMLYLGNYNLIEGNDTSSQVKNNLYSLVKKNEDSITVLKDNTLFDSACNQDLNQKNIDIIAREGGITSPVSKSVHKTNQVLATLCSKNV
jgi:hypothetical protein